jgi:hypothetical protein
MADEETIPKTAPARLTMKQIHSLVDRLASRADAIENIAAQDLADDLRLAARVILALVRSFNGTDVVTLSGT